MKPKYFVKDFEAERPENIMNSLNVLAKNGYELHKIVVLPPILSKIGLAYGSHRLFHYFKYNEHCNKQYRILECIPDTSQKVQDELNLAISDGWDLFDIVLISSNPYPKIFHYFVK